MKIAVYGANGFTGKLVAAELASHDIELVLAGRDLARLRDAARQIGAPDAEPRASGLDEPAALREVFQDCDAVINCVTPFSSFGEPVVRAAIAAGSHYVDIAGEQEYLKRIFDTYPGEAERAGVTVVPAMTDDGLPGDLIASLTAARIGDADDVTIADLRVPAGASRGTARMALSNVDELKSGGLTYEDGQWTTGTRARLTSITPPGDHDPVPVVKFPLPGVVTVPRHVTARHVEGVIRGEVAAIFTSVTAELVDSMPEGPAEDARRAGQWLMMAQATSSSSGRRARGAVRGTDGYGVTAVIAAEGARRLASGGVKPGVLAPSQAFDATGFLETLAPYGVRWHIDVDQLDS
jgi:short subunit dehydrogenase-like uncharacterized protein